MSNEFIPTFDVGYIVGAPTTGFTIDVTAANLDLDLNIKDFVVFNTTLNLAVSTTFWVKNSRTVITYVGPNLLTGSSLRVSRSTELARIQETLQLGSAISSSILDAEVLRIYKLLAEKIAAFAIFNPVNNVTRSTDTPSIPPVSLGDEWHQFTASGSGGSIISTIRVWVATSIDGSIDTLGWFEVTGVDGDNGTNGLAATVNVGTTTTGLAGTQALVENVGTANAAVLNFSIPRGNTGTTGATGATGATGTQGSAGTLAIGSVTTGEPGTQVVIDNTGTPSAAIVDITIPRGNTGANGLNGSYAPLVEVALTTLSHVLVATDAGKGVTMDNAAANTVTIPTNATVSFAIGTRIPVFQVGPGATTIQGAVGVSVNGTDAGSVVLPARWNKVVLWKRGVDSWLISV